MEKIIIIGAGPGGYETAIRAAQLGFEVTIIEKSKLGGTCVNNGCIPTKTLYRIAQLYDDIKLGSTMGIISNANLDTDMIEERKEYVMNRMIKGIKFTLESYKNITVVEGTASFLNDREVVVENNGVKETYTADHIIIATGSKSNIPPLDGVDLDKVLTSDDLLKLKEIPKSMTIIGTGVIAMEFASIYAKLGSKVTVVGSELLKQLDEETTQRLKDYLVISEIKFNLGYRVKSIKKEGESLVVSATKDDTTKTFQSEYVLIATGRVANTESLDLDKTSIDVEKDSIKVDKNFKTSVKNIYAIGDCVYKNIQLAHVAAHQGMYVVESIKLGHSDINLNLIPSVIFTLPEVAMIGLTEQKCKEENRDYKISKFLYATNGKAVSEAKADGYVKLIVDSDSDQILGCHAIGQSADMFVHFALIAMDNNIQAKKLTSIIFAHPTLGEIFMDAVNLLGGKSVNSPFISNELRKL